LKKKTLGLKKGKGKRIIAIVIMDFYMPKCC
jgi:hypothetical protein